MAEGRPPSGEPLSPDQVAHRSFPLVRRGFEPAAVRAFLEQVAAALEELRRREAGLRRQLGEAEHRPTGPVDEAALTAALGQQAAHILQSAREAAAEITAKAAAEAERLVRGAREEAARLQERAAGLWAERSAEAEAAAAEIRRAARAEANAQLGEARGSAEALLARAHDECRSLVREAQELRSRTLQELARRRRLLQIQVEQLRAGRRVLVETIEASRRQVDALYRDLRQVEEEARAAAEAAGQSLGDHDGIDAVLSRAAEPAVPAGTSGSAEAPVAAEEPDSQEPRSQETPTEALDRLESSAQPSSPAQSAAELDAAEASESVAGEEPGSPEADVASPPGPKPPVSVSSSPPGLSDAAAPLGLEAPPPSPDPAPLAGEAAPAPAAEEEPAPPEPGPSVPEPGQAESAQAEEGQLPEPGLGQAPLEASVVTEQEAPGEGQRISSTVRLLRLARQAARKRSGAAGTEAEGADEVEGLRIVGTTMRRPPLQLRQRRGHPAGSEAREEPAHTTPMQGIARIDAPVAAELAAEGPGRAEQDQALLGRRDQLARPITTRLVRDLRAALAEEEGEALRGWAASQAAVSGDPEASQVRYRQAAAGPLEQAVRAGAELVGPGAVKLGDPRSAAVEEAAILALELTMSLRARLESQPRPTAEAVAAAYREWRGRRLQRLAGDHVSSALAVGAVLASPDAARLRWIFCDEGGLCPECQANAEAGSKLKGEQFPSGHKRPPVHPGCRCLLLPVP